ncbi:HAMP domain-containing protein [Roseomonas sp. JC162]|uniref:HAMP domain-containing protein n=1 Tax=Neoroseomonas marina TaxID=1232220 RepID=A0A848EG89_9PROT|nr:cache domain-containing protein [Neoroseomonas marina]NMJ42443.1 HAMP domain-containing protein [Neoroseomonas marina]
MRRIPTRTLPATLVLLVIFAAILPLIASIPGFLAASRTNVGDRAAVSLTAAARQISARLGAGIAEQWAELRTVAGWAAAEGVGGSLPLRLDAAKELNGRLAWMGIAAPDGRVLIATRRILEGQDVSARPWFRAGLQGDFAGDLHDALLLARHLAPAPGGEPIRLIDFAMPLRRADGSLIGVIGSHVDWGWMRDRVRRAPLPPGVDAMLAARDGTVIVGPEGLEGTRLTQRSALAGGQGVSTVTQEQWPDGRRYLAAAVPAGTAEGVPGFGWTVIVRQPPEAAFGEVRSLAGEIGVPLLASGVVILLVGLLVARAVAKPFGRLADAATALAEGRLDSPVPDTRSTREAALLSAALARLDRPPAQGTTAAGGKA